MKLYDSDSRSYSKHVISCFEGAKDCMYDDTIFTTFKGAKRDAITRVKENIMREKYILQLLLETTCKTCPTSINPFTDI